MTQIQAHLGKRRVWPMDMITRVSTMKVDMRDVNPIVPRWWIQCSARILDMGADECEIVGGSLTRFHSFCCPNWELGHANRSTQPISPFPLHSPPVVHSAPDMEGAPAITCRLIWEAYQPQLIKVCTPSWKLTWTSLGTRCNLAPGGISPAPINGRIQRAWMVAEDVSISVPWGGGLIEKHCLETQVQRAKDIMTTKATPGSCGDEHPCMDSLALEETHNSNASTLRYGEASPRRRWLLDI